uniref:Uncharacterized protein n=1 Tax=Acrobeloides nanus TaxID=290746 RepID=A0A914CES1_9BILA
MGSGTGPAYDRDDHRLQWKPSQADGKTQVRFQSERTQEPRSAIRNGRTYIKHTRPKLGRQGASRVDSETEDQATVQKEEGKVLCGQQPKSTLNRDLFIVL